MVIENPEAAIQILLAAGFDAKADNGSVVVEAEDGSEIVESLAREGMFPSEVRPERTTLESVFLGITGEEEG